MALRFSRRITVIQDLLVRRQFSLVPDPIKFIDINQSTGFPMLLYWVRNNCDMIFINLTRKIARWTCSSVTVSNEPSKPIRIKKIHSHLIITFVRLSGTSEN
jgi:hypothetical protein